MKLQLNKRLLGPNGKFDIDVEVSIGEKKLITLYGESGAGKTSILKMIAGLLEPDNGYIEIDDQRWYSSEEKINLKPQLRNVGFVFQEYALFPNMTVLQNLEYALDAKQNKMIISELIDMIELGDLRHRKPETLSGGQKQRVALARALVRKPRLLLLDEPLSALDQTMRIKLQDYILRVHRKFELTTLLVSHEVGEVVKMSDEILVLNEGKIIQRETPLELFSKKGVSGKFKFTGDIIAIERQEVVFVISVLIGNNLVKVVADEREAVHLQVGDEVMVASKAFNPIIQKINQPS